MSMFFMIIISHSYWYFGRRRGETHRPGLALSAFPFAQSENHSPLMIAECIHACSSTSTSKVKYYSRLTVPHRPSSLSVRSASGGTETSFFSIPSFNHNPPAGTRHSSKRIISLQSKERKKKKRLVAPAPFIDLRLLPSVATAPGSVTLATSLSPPPPLPYHYLNPSTHHALSILPYYRRATDVRLRRGEIKAIS